MKETPSYKRGRNETLLTLYDQLKDQPPDVCKKVLLDIPEMIQKLDRLDREERRSRQSPEYTFRVIDGGLLH